MPPTDSRYEPLTDTEKSTIREWIANGAPDATSASASAGLPTPVAQPVPSAFAQRAVRWLGKFHLMLLHFPIALVLAAGVGELLTVWRGSRVPSPAVGFCLILAAVAVVPTVAFGWLHAEAGNGLGSPQLLAAHRWLGTMTGVWVIGTALWAAREARRGLRGWGVRIVLAVGILLVSVSAHLGGLMAHGVDFFDW